MKILETANIKKEKKTFNFPQILLAWNVKYKTHTFMTMNSCYNTNVPINF